MPSAPMRIVFVTARRIARRNMHAAFELLRDTFRDELRVELRLA